MTEFGLGLVGALVLAALIMQHQRLCRLERSLRDPHSHCLHRVFASAGSTIVHRQCCHCGRVVSTHVIEAADTGTLRVQEHGPYVVFKSSRDMTNGAA